MSVNIASALLKKRIKNRKLPGLNIPQTGMEEVDRALLQMREYLQMYEGDTKAPKERFVTLEELENAGLLGTATRQGFSTINKILGVQVDPVKSTNTTRKQILEITKTGAETLSELADSEVDGANPNDFFAYDGSNWVNRGLFNADNVWTGVNRFSKGYIEFQERQTSDGPVAQAGRGYIWLEDGKTLYFRDEDGADTDLTAAGGGGLNNVVEDVTPQLGGDLDSNGSDIIFADNDQALFGTGSDASIYFDGSNLIVDGLSDTFNIHFQNFGSHRFYDVGGTDYLYIEHDGTDAYIGGVNSADLVLQFFTGLTATSLTVATLGNHVYDADQTVGAGQDNYVMTYDDALGTIQLEAAAGGGSNATPLDIIGDINLATPPVAAAFTGLLRIVDNDETDVAAEFGFDGDGAGVVQSLYIRNFVTNGMTIFENDEFAGTQTETLRLYGGRAAVAGQEAYAMANRLICNYNGTFGISDDDPPLMVTRNADDGQSEPFMGFWYNNIQSFGASAATNNPISINAQGGDINLGNMSGGGTSGGLLVGHDLIWQLRTATDGLVMSWRSSTAPSGGAVPNDSFYKISSHGQLVAIEMGARASDNSAVLTHEIHGAPWIIEGQNEVGNPRKIGVFETTQAISGLYVGETNQQSSLWLWEEAAELTSQAGWGQVWVKSGTPNTLWFTDDAGTAVQLGAGGGGSDTPWSENHDAAGYDLTDVGTLGIYDAGGTDQLTISHNGTDIEFAEGAGTTSNFSIKDQIRLKLWDATNTDHIQIWNDGSVAWFTGTGLSTVSFTGFTTMGLPSGTELRIADSTNIDNLYMSHDGTDFNMKFDTASSVTVDLNIIGLTGSLVMQDIGLLGPVLTDYAVQSQSEVISANAATLTYTEGNAFELTLAAATGNVTVTLSGGPPSGTYGVMEVKILQDGTARTITWAGGTFVWLDDTAHVMNPTVTTGISVYVFETWDGGTTWYASGVNYGP